MKQPGVKPQFGENWTWPRKTWLQERLNIVKARERESQHKPDESPQNSTAVDTAPTSAEDFEES